MCGEEEMVATNEYRDFKTETNEKFEEMDFDDREYKFSSIAFTELDMNAVNSIRKHDPVIVPMVTDNTKLHKRMICKNKETLQHIVNCFVIIMHHMH